MASAGSPSARVEIADALHDVGVAAFVLGERNQDVARARLVERRYSRFRGEQQQIDVGAPRLDQRFGVRSRFFGAAECQQ